MKILFICGSYESGKDGVGDYIRILSNEFDKSKFQVSVVAINDVYIKSILLDSKRDGIASLRIPSHLSPKNRYKNALDYIQETQPDVISLQFVSYALHPKGLPLGFPSFLESLPKNVFRHLMFHEIWIAISNDCSRKEKIVGYFQRKLIQKICAVFKADRMSCSNYMFHKLLERKGIQTDIIPLCSNMPIADRDQVFMDSVFKAINIEKSVKQEWRIMGLFGNLYSDSCVDLILQEQIELYPDKKLLLLSFGKLGEFSQNELRNLSQRFSEKVRFCSLGMLSEQQVSNVMQMIDVGVCGTPSMYVAKSGALAAMKLHGLEVLFSDGLDDIDFLEENKVYNKTFLNRPSEEWSARYVAKIYTDMFQKRAQFESINS